MVLEISEDRPDLCRRVGEDALSLELDHLSHSFLGPGASRRICLCQSVPAAGSGPEWAPPVVNQRRRRGPILRPKPAARLKDAGTMSSVSIVARMRRSEEGRVGKECVSTCISRCASCHYKQKQK